ncbi:MAG: 50S ribosomal protein L14e [Candidatus Diapherotrites archaeon]|nr:50S ribosomal protein L14e [Candidatus Diapherotrites archaeon]
MLFEIGRICVKTRGKDAGKECVIVDVVDENYVLIDGNGIKRRRCNVKHLEPTQRKLNIKKDAPHKDILALLKKG